MPDTTPLATPEELVGRLLESFVGAVDIFSIYIGEQLGLYRALAERGPMTAAELSAATGMDARYAREWLEQQATTGLLTAEVSSNDADRRFALPAGYEAVLVDPTSDLFVAPMGRFLNSMIACSPKLMEAYRSGGGVDWEAYGAEARTAQADFNRPFFTNALVDGYLRNVPGLDASLGSGAARVAEIGPGGGWALIAMAKAYPGLRGDGFDLDGPSVEMARANISSAGLGDRLSVHHEDAANAALMGEYDLVAAFECIHDMSDPVAVLATMRRLAKPGGTILVMDERVGEEFGAVGDLIERFMYGASLVICLPNGLASQPSAATGTVMRPPTLRRYALAAGFRDVEILPLEHDLFRFYRLVA